MNDNLLIVDHFHLVLLNLLLKGLNLLQLVAVLLEQLVILLYLMEVSLRGRDGKSAELLELLEEVIFQLQTEPGILIFSFRSFEYI